MPLAWLLEAVVLRGLLLARVLVALLLLEAPLALLGPLALDAPLDLLARRGLRGLLVLLVPVVLLVLRVLVLVLLAALVLAALPEALVMRVLLGLLDFGLLDLAVARALPRELPVAGVLPAPADALALRARVAAEPLALRGLVLSFAAPLDELASAAASLRDEPSPPAGLVASRDASLLLDAVRLGVLAWAISPPAVGNLSRPEPFPMQGVATHMPRGEPRGPQSQGVGPLGTGSATMGERPPRPLRRWQSAWPDLRDR